MSSLVRAAILQYFAGQDQRRSSAGSVLEAARLWANVQSSRDPEAGLVRWDPSCMRLCTRAHIEVLRAYYWPATPRLQWQTQIVMLGGEPWLDADGEPRTEVVQVARDSTDREAAHELGCTWQRAREIRAEAESLVRQALQLVAREHERKCE